MLFNILDLSDIPQNIIKIVFRFQMCFHNQRHEAHFCVAFFLSLILLLAQGFA